MSGDSRADRWRRVEELYHAAVSLAPAQRAAYLNGACKSDVQLRHDVDALLAVAGDAESFLESNARSMVGRRIGHYQITALIGAGGMGEVYRATDSRLGRDVAIKIIPPELTTDPERLARFEREARLLAALNHPHLGGIYGVEEQDDVRALILELVDGRTLAEHLTAGPLPIGDALAIARQIADALEAAHEKGIIHRDLKPANIKITPDGIVKVLDFGLATIDAFGGPEPNLSRSPTVTVGRTGVGVLLGTAAYMSPEQARGKAQNKQTDIWAFACVLYEMLTGRAAFEGETLSDLIAAILSRDPAWTTLPTTTPPIVRRLLQRCLEKDLKRRLHDIADARIEIDDAVSNLQNPERTAASLGESRRWRTVLAIGVTALATAVAVTLVLKGRQEPVSTPMRWTAQIIPTELTNYGGTEASPALSPDGGSFVFVSDHGGTPDIWLRQVSGGEPIRLTNDAAEEADLVYAPDGDSIYFTRIDADGPAVWRIGALGGQARKVLGNARKPAPSPDGRRLAYYEPDGNVFTLAVSALQGNERRTLVRGILGGESAIRPAWSPDGRWLSYCPYGLAAPKNLFVVDARTAQVRQITHFVGGNEGIDQHMWLPDSRHLVVSYVPFSRVVAPFDLGILDVNDASITRLTMSIDQGLGAPSLSRDGSRLIATASQVRREVWKIPFGPDPDANGRAAVRLLDSRLDPRWISTSRDSRTLLFNSASSGSRNLWTMPLGGNAPPRQVTAVAGDTIAHASLSPDGARLAFASIASGGSHIWTQGIDGTDLHQLTNDAAGADAWPVWSPDGRWIAFNSVRENHHETWRILAAGGHPEKLVDGFFRGDWIQQPAGSGTWLVSSLGAGGVRLIDVERRRVMWEWHHAERLSQPVFSPDGRFISVPLPEGRDRDAIWLIDAATGAARPAVRFTGAFHIFFTAGWIDNGKALIVNRSETLSHIVLFDHFWTRGPRAED